MQLERPAQRVKQAAPDPLWYSSVPRKQLNTDIRCIHETLQKDRSAFLGVDEVQATDRNTGVHDLVAVGIKHMASVSCIANDADKAVVRCIVELDCFQVRSKSLKSIDIAASSATARARALQKMHSVFCFLGRYRDNADIGLDLLTLSSSGLIEGQAAGVPDRERGHDCLGPRSPFALRGTHRRQQPAAVVVRIRHVTSPVSDRAIVCGRNT